MWYLLATAFIWWMRTLPGDFKERVYLSKKFYDKHFAPLSSIKDTVTGESASCGEGACQI